MQQRAVPQDTEPGTDTTSVTLSVPSGNLVADELGESAIATIQLRYRLVPDAGSQGAGTAADESWTEAEVSAGSDVPLELVTGEYEFEARGLSAESQLLGVGTRQLTVQEDSTSFELELQPVLGSIKLTATTALDAVTPGSEVSFQLKVFSPGDAYAIAPAAYTAEFYVTNGEEASSGADQINVSVHSDATGELTVTATVTGLVSTGEDLGEETLEDKVVLPIEEPDDEPNYDIAPPVLEFEPLDGNGLISGTVTDNSGLPALAVFEGETLLGSIAGGQITVSGPSGDVWTWQMDWSPESGEHILRAVATDEANNQTIRFQALYAEDPEVAPGDLETYRTVSGTMDGSGGKLEDSGFCPVNELMAPGQGLQAVGAGLQAVGAGLQAVGAVGGLFLSDTADFESSLVSVETVAEELAYKATGDEGTAVTLLLVDDFGDEDVFELPAEVLSGTVTAEELSALAEAGSISHGALVLHHVRMLLTALDYEKQTAVSGEETWENSEPQTIKIVNVNIHGLSTTPDGSGDTIQDRMAQAVENLTNHRQVVVNMSFVILPCSVQADLQASGIHTFEDYLAALAAVNGIAANEVPEVEQNVLNAQNDPLLDYFECPVRDASGACIERFEALIHVGAAGNYGSDFVLYPAAAPNVISVSSVDATVGGVYTTERSAFSNLGGVMTPGAMYELASSGGRTIAYAGTSFAAPVVTVFTALDLMHDPRTCYPGGTHPTGMAPPNLARDILESDPAPLLRAYGDGSRSAVEVACYGEDDAPSY